jgi:outer membrane protein OmpA-like peptidoglycan-associated protein
MAVKFNSIANNRRIAPRLLLGCALLIPAFAASHSVSAATPTNGLLFYRTRGASGFQIKAVDTSGAEQTLPINFPATSTPPSVSTDGTKMVWIENDRAGNGDAGSVKVANTDGSEVITLGTHNKRLANPQFSADKKTVFFNDQDGNIYSLDSSTTNQTVAGSEILTDTTRGTLMSFQVSSTGKIAYLMTRADCTGGATGYGIYLRDVSGNGVGTYLPKSCEKTVNTDFPATSAGRFQWNSDGSKLYVSRELVVNGGGGIALRSAHYIDEYNADGPISSTPFYSNTINHRSIYEMALSPDNTKIVFLLMDRSTSPETAIALFQLDIATKNVSELLPLTQSLVELVWAPKFQSSTPTTTEETTTTAAPTTTIAPPPTTTLPPAPIAGVTVTDTKIYTKAPQKVASGSAIAVLSTDQIRTQKIVSLTPSVCLPTNDDIVFIDEGRCTANILSKKTGEVLRRLRTTVVEDKVTTLGIGNEVVILAPIFFENGSATINTRGRNRIKNLTTQINAAGTIMVVGHSGIMLGDTPENRALSRSRATNTVRAIKSAGGTGPFYSIGAGTSDPEVNSTNRDVQAKNRRVVIVLVP